MKICFLGNNRSVHIQKWIKTLSEYNDIKLYVISFDLGIRFDKVRYYPLKKYIGNKIDYLLNIKLLKKYVKQIEPDIVHAQYATSYGFMGATLNFHPYIITGWGADIFDSPKKSIMKKVLKYSFKKADKLTVLSKITQREMIKLTNKEVELVPFGVNTEKFRKNKIYQKDNLIRIGTIRTLSKKYGVEYLIRAFAMLSPKYSNIRLEIVGDGELMKFLDKLSSELNVRDKVTFHGFVSQLSEEEKYHKLLENLDVFVIPSIIDSETFGVAAVEASAYSIPVVASDVGGLPEVVENEHTGLIVPAKDVEKLAIAIEKLILDENLRKTLGKNGRKRVMKYFNWKDNVQQMISIYNALIEKNKK